MMTFAIVFGFAMMLFLPCAIALMSSREIPLTAEDSPYADRIPDQIVTPVAETVEVAEVASEAPAKVGAMGELKLSDPVVARDGVRSSLGRVERAELEAVRARAVAIRAHAEALAAIARAATAKAEVAAEEAEEAEIDAEEAMQGGRRAA